MLVIGIACSCRPGSSSLKAVEEFLRGAAESGHKTELIKLNKDFRGCIGCQGCKQGDGLCVQKDALARYFELLPRAGAVVFGAAIYMGYPQGEAWSFMNRHYCLTTADRKPKLETVKKIYPIIAQGAPDNPAYRANCEAMCKPFANYGLEVQPLLVVNRSDAEQKIAEAYELGKAMA